MVERALQEKDQKTVLPTQPSIYTALLSNNITFIVSSGPPTVGPGGQFAWKLSATEWLNKEKKKIIT